MANLEVKIFPPMAEEQYSVLFSLYEYNEEKEDDELICQARGYIFKLLKGLSWSIKQIQ